MAGLLRLSIPFTEVMKLKKSSKLLLGEGIKIVTRTSEVSTGLILRHDLAYF